MNFSRRLIPFLCLASLLLFSRPTTAEAQLYCRAALVYVGDVGTKYKIDKHTLAKYGSAFAGRPVILAHNWRDPRLCIGTIMTTSMRKDKHGLHLSAILRIWDDDAERRIKRQLYKWLSIGMSRISYVCSLCGQTGCRRHWAGSTVITGKGPQRVTHNINGFLAQEVSVINVPASRWARITEILAGVVLMPDPKAPKPEPRKSGKPRPKAAPPRKR